MEHDVPSGNPFMLMTNPEVVLKAIENSERLGRLQSRMCRPLDKPILGVALAGGNELDDDDETDAVDSEAVAL